MASFKHLTFLKVLAVIAWADGEMTESEKNILKKFYRTFGLGKDDIRQINPYLLAPIPKKEQERLFLLNKSTIGATGKMHQRTGFIRRKEN